MTVASSVEADASSEWCCAPMGFLRRRKTSQGIYKSIVYDFQPLTEEKVTEKHGDDGLLDGQPRPIPRRSSEGTGDTTWKTTTTLASARRSFSRVRRKSKASSRRLSISAPTNFRHVSSASHMMADYPSFQPSRRPPLADSPPGPLQLNMFSSDMHMSPILPNFELPGPVPSPPPAYVTSELSQEYPFVRQRSFSTISFHVPRKAVPENAEIVRSESPGSPPLRPSNSRQRSYTASELEAQKERIASSMIEVEKLQQQIDDVVERQSLYSSRRSSVYSLARTVPEDLEPMPSIPALPPVAPSFAERLNTDSERPRTAPHFPKQAVYLNQPRTEIVEAMPPPPLPLILRPPLRKKKSFSRVSSWLSSHKRQVSMNSITNEPLPLKDSDGFYQCAPVLDFAERQSLYSSGSFSARSSYSMESTPLDGHDDEVTTTNVHHYGKSASIMTTSSVGMAM